MEHTETAELPPDLEARQLELEAEMVAKGAETYDKQRERLSEADTAPGRNLLRKALPELVSAIREQARSTCTGRGGHLHPCKKLACGVDEWHLQPESVAVLTLRTALQTLDDDEAPGLTSLAHSLGELIRESRLWESSEQRQVNSAQEELDWSNKEMTALGAWLPSAWRVGLLLWSRKYCGCGRIWKTGLRPTTNAEGCWYPNTGRWWFHRDPGQHREMVATCVAESP